MNLTPTQSLQAMYARRRMNREHATETANNKGENGMFENLKKMLNEEYENKKRENAFFIENGYLSTWREDERVFSDRGIERYSTQAKWDAYKAGQITREKAVQLATARRWRELDKDHAKDLAKLDAAEAAPDVKSVVVEVEWKRSRTWGYNPHASVVINKQNRYFGSASGCGYDKRTAAVASALNQSAVIARMLYQAKEKALADGYDPEKWKNHGPETNSGCIHYGAGYGTLPYFEGGVGMSSFEGVFNACGLKLTHCNTSGKYYDYYYFERVGE